MHRQNGRSGLPAGREDNEAAPERRLGWRTRRRRSRGNARRTPGTDPVGGQAAAMSSVWPGLPVPPGSPVPPAPGEIVASAMQLAIALLTAGLDSPELEAWAADALTPSGAEGLGDLIAGLHVISVLLLHELHEATDEPPPAILQRLALLAENGRGKPSAG